MCGGGTVSTLPDQVTIEPVAALAGLADLPGDKSVSHRALLLSAYSEGTSRITGLSSGDDVMATATIVGQLGADLHVDGTTVTVVGGRSRLRPSPTALDCGNSGTGIRLLMGFVAGIPGHHVLVGDVSLSSRPMDRVATPLRLMGASVDGIGDRVCAPISIDGGPLRGIEYHVLVASAQVKSAILLAALWAEGPTTVVEGVATRPNTEEMIAQAGGSVEVEHSDERSAITVRPGRLDAVDWQVPSDPSQAAFFVVAGLLAGAGELSCRNLYGDATRVGFLTVLERMGGAVSRRHEPTGLLDVSSSSSSLHGTVVHASEIPSLDEVPILAVAAAAASGTTRFVDVAELRIKESDRFARTIDLVCRLGAAASAEGDDLVIHGLGTASRFNSFSFDAEHDHRMAMSAAIAGLVGAGATISGFATVASSFPSFLDVVAAIS